MGDTDSTSDLYTARQPPADLDMVSRPIAEAVVALRAVFPGQALPVLHWNEHYVAVPMEVTVELPGRGPIGGIDIREREPIFLLFNRRGYPYKAPLAHSNRKDFPKSKVPHLNPTKPAQPASFCLHRGNLDTWFAEHTVVDLVGRTRSWLRDAARNRLIPRDDVFEPTRPIETTGHALFDPEKFRTIIFSGLSELHGSASYRFVSYELLDKDATAAIGLSGYTARCITVDDAANTKNELQLAQVFNDLANTEEYKKLFRKRLFGVLAWADGNAVSSEYITELPNNLATLLSWTASFGVPLREALQEYLASNLQLLAGIPVTIAIRRPTPVLGSDSDLELITFLIIAGGEHWAKDGEWDTDAEVVVTDHRTPLTPEFARHVSSHARDVALPRTLLLGCGALGSKVALHFARSGQTAMTLVDPAVLSPHNVVRHALGGRHIGKAKAEALKQDIAELYPDETPVSLGLDAKTANALDYLVTDRRNELNEYAHLIDATASMQAFNMLVSAQLPAAMSVARIEIADRGRLGLLSAEGPNRNPRIDDLQVRLFDTALDDSAISNWLAATRDRRETEVGSGLEDVQVGLSCGSATMRLADETVALHAASMTARLRSIFSGQSSVAHGALHCAVIDDAGDVRTTSASVEPVTITTARNDSAWQIRFAAGLVDRMKDALRRARPNETGGILIGLVHAKRRIVYVTRLLDAPRDSAGSPAAFFRGVADLPEAVSEIEKRSGGLLGYVGEWHTHPDGGPDLSTTDLVAVSLLKRQLDRVPLPTHVVVVTPRGAYPHVFEPDAPGLLIRGKFLIVRRYDELR
jgi:molybdopterin/thiamine biosynthesis adenylyltransferase/proteasome lid subunit RPN8/RPN11